MTRLQRYSDIELCAGAIIDRLAGQIRMALPLGLGKPALLVNAIYRRAKADSRIRLHIYTALTLERPRPGNELEARLLYPLNERLYQEVPELEYASDQRTGALPENINIEEFFFRPGAYLNLPCAQQNYTSLNYTQVAQALVSRGVNLIAQMVAPAIGADDAKIYSLSSNPDVTLDLMDAARVSDGPVPLLVGEVNPALPFMPGEAALPAAAFDMLLESKNIAYPLFPIPNQAVSLGEYAIALRAASLIRDGGTLQIGIGSLGDALAYAIGLRRTHNSAYRQLIAALRVEAPELDDLPNGLYGASEMLVEGFLHLREQGVMRRLVDRGVYLHAGFFLGSGKFYDRLRTLSADERAGIAMARISFTNRLLGDEQRKRHDRRDARFINTTMMMTLMGAAISDGLEDGRVVSGVGGQYNFVAMAHELEGARSIMLLPATRLVQGRLTSNILWRYGHETIPRHLRDMVITEYGIADLRYASDQNVIAALLNLADSRFQESLRAQAVSAGKLPGDYRIPEQHRNNHPETIERALKDTDLLRALPFYPLGTDLTDEEAALAVALQALAKKPRNFLALFKGALNGLKFRQDLRLQNALQRLDLQNPRTLREHLYRALVAGEFKQAILDSGRALFDSADR